MEKTKLDHETEDWLIAFRFCGWLDMCPFGTSSGEQHLISSIFILKQYKS